MASLRELTPQERRTQHTDKLPYSFFPITNGSLEQIANGLIEPIRLDDTFHLYIQGNETSGWAGQVEQGDIESNAKPAHIEIAEQLINRGVTTVVFSRHRTLIHQEVFAYNGE